MPHDAFGRSLKPGHNVDPVDVAAGLAELTKLGETDVHTRLVIEHALLRWARGEEEAAERLALDRYPESEKLGHGIDYTGWRRVLAAAIAAGTAHLDRVKRIVKIMEDGILETPNLEEIAVRILHSSVITEIEQNAIRRAGAPC